LENRFLDGYRRQAKFVQSHWTVDAHVIILLQLYVICLTGLIPVLSSKYASIPKSFRKEPRGNSGQQYSDGRCRS